MTGDKLQVCKIKFLRLKIPFFIITEKFFHNLFLKLRVSKTSYYLSSDVSAYIFIIIFLLLECKIAVQYFFCFLLLLLSLLLSLCSLDQLLLFDCILSYYCKKLLFGGLLLLLRLEEII
jgi:hypothetical protein